MKEVLMTSKQVMEEIEFEAQWGVNDLAQHLLLHPDAEAYNIVSDEGEPLDWVIRDKNTGEDIHL